VCQKSSRALNITETTVSTVSWLSACIFPLNCRNGQRHCLCAIIHFSASPGAPDQSHCSKMLSATFGTAHSCSCEKSSLNGTEQGRLSRSDEMTACQLLLAGHFCQAASVDSNLLDMGSAVTWCCKEEAPLGEPVGRWCLASVQDLRRPTCPLASP